MGLAEVARIEAEMDAILGAEGYTDGSVGERMQHLAEDPRFLYPDTNAGRQTILADYRALVAEIQPRLGELFGRLPRSDDGSQLRDPLPTVTAPDQGAEYDAADKACGCQCFEPEWTVDPACAVENGSFDRDGEADWQCMRKNPPASNRCGREARYSSAHGRESTGQKEQFQTGGAVADAAQPDFLHDGRQEHEQHVADNHCCDTSHNIRR